MNIIVYIMVVNVHTRCTTKASEEIQMFHADEPDMPTIMPSSITDLMDCAAKYLALRVLREWPSRPPHMGAEFGIGFHQVVRQVYDPRNGPLPCLDHLLVWTRAAFFARRYSDPAFRDKEIDRCCRVVCAYTAEDEDAQATIAVEQEGIIPLPTGYTITDLGTTPKSGGGVGAAINYRGQAVLLGVGFVNSNDF